MNILGQNLAHIGTMQWHMAHVIQIYIFDNSRDFAKKKLAWSYVEDNIVSKSNFVLVSFSILYYQSPLLFICDKSNSVLLPVNRKDILNASEANKSPDVLAECDQSLLTSVPSVQTV